MTGRASVIEYPELEVCVFSSVESLAQHHHLPQEFGARESIENSIDWFELQQKHVYSTDDFIRYFVALENGQPTTILPLRKTSRRGVRTWESLSSFYASLYGPLSTRANDPLAIRRILSAMKREDPAVHVMRLAPMDPESPHFSSLLNELRAAGWVALTYFCFGNWFLQLKAGWEDYLRCRSGSLRSNIKRAKRDFFGAGGTLEVISGNEKLEAAVSAYLEVYAASWKMPEPFPEFVPSLIRLLASKGMLRLGIARVQDRPIAAQLWIVSHGKASIYKVAYHEEFASLSPGTVLTSYLMQHVIEVDRVTEVDFLMGDDAYKKVWMSQRRERWGIVAFNPRTTIGGLLLLKELLWRFVKKRFFDKSHKGMA